MGMRLFRAQGATEYLVLLAVVLIVALVSVALLGFFPGMASDAQITQSQAYWRSASPIAIVETDAKASESTVSWPYLRIRNTGAYPIRITKILGVNSQSISYFYCAATCGGGGAQLLLSSYNYLSPGEENYFGWAGHGVTNRAFALSPIGSAPAGNVIYSASSVCATTAPFGTLAASDFGFEYIEYVDNQQITKKQIGKPLIIKCTG